ncbi:MAG: histidine phosphatase family protein [Treponema sp.]|nr:histidine phosphatase family protein [Treponema sp.]
MELYLVRHGTTDWNAEKKFQGACDIELNENGRILAAELGCRLDKNQIDFDSIYSSPLIRAYETACLIRGHKTYPIIKNELLTEISFGELEGIPYSEWINTEEPRKYFFTEPAKYVPPKNGETLDSVCERTKKFVQTVIEPLQKSKPDSRIMIVAHGALLAGMMCYLDEHGIENYWGNGLKGNCEETIYQYDGKKWTKTSKEEVRENPYEKGRTTA